jgi:hypothetical protein
MRYIMLVYETPADVDGRDDPGRPGHRGMAGLSCRNLRPSNAIRVKAGIDNPGVPRRS